MVGGRKQTAAPLGNMLSPRAFDCALTSPLRCTDVLVPHVPVAGCATGKRVILFCTLDPHGCTSGWSNAARSAGWPGAVIIRLTVLKNPLSR